MKADVGKALVTLRLGETDGAVDADGVADGDEEGVPDDRMVSVGTGETVGDSEGSVGTLDVEDDGMTEGIVLSAEGDGLLVVGLVLGNSEAGPKLGAALPG